MSPSCKPIQIGGHLRTTYNTQDPHEYIEKLKASTDEELYEACRQMIWLSAYAGNNPHSDYHWQCDACYAECKSRGKVDQIYSKAYEAVARSI